MKETNENLTEKPVILLGLNTALQITSQIQFPVHKDTKHPREQESMDDIIRVRWPISVKNWLRFCASFFFFTSLTFLSSMFHSIQCIGITHTCQMYPSIFQFFSCYGKCYSFLISDGLLLVCKTTIQFCILIL